MICFHPTLFFEDEMHRLTLHNILVILFALEYQNEAKDKMVPWNRTVGTPASNFQNKESDPWNQIVWTGLYGSKKLWDM